MVERFGNLFKKPVETEEEAEFDINCQDHVRDILPELTIENVEKLASILAKDTGYSFADGRLNAIMRRFHRLRYKM